MPGSLVYSTCLLDCRQFSSSGSALLRDQGAETLIISVAEVGVGEGPDRRIPRPTGFNVAANEH